jgi:16S rRNA C1402 N4-methylase RsmH
LCQFLIDKNTHCLKSACGTVFDSGVEQTLLKDLGKSFASKEELNNNKRSRSAISIPLLTV